MMTSVKTAWARITRAPYQTLAAVSIMTMTLFLASVFLLLAAGSQAVLKYFETRPQVNAFFSVDYIPTPDEVDAIKGKLENTGKMDSFTYISKEDALVLYKDLNKFDPALIEAVTAQMLPASLEISAHDPKDLKPLADILKSEKGVDDVRFAEDVVSSLTTWVNSVRVIGISLVGAHVLITLVIILLIIGIKVANRRDEIILLQLAGATPGYISGPFIWEGVIYGIIGAVIAWAVSYLLLLLSMDFLQSFLAGVPIFPIPVLFMLELLGSELVIGAFVGSVGGILATRRFLKA